MTLQEIKQFVLQLLTAPTLIITNYDSKLSSLNSYIIGKFKLKQFDNDFLAIAGGLNIGDMYYRLDGSVYVVRDHTLLKSSADLYGNLLYNGIGADILYPTLESLEAEISALTITVLKNSGDIANEVNARASSINNEIFARANADSLLQAQITNNLSTTINNINAINTNAVAINGNSAIINNEIAVRAAADTAINNILSTLQRRPGVLLEQIQNFKNNNINNKWTSICYGNGLFVAVSKTGTGNRVMTSTSRFGWTERFTPADNDWSAVCYGNGLFVAVANASAVGFGGQRVMTSPDGINWTLRTVQAANWSAVCYGNGLFVAVANAGNAGTFLMTSPDGITWTPRNYPVDNAWTGICYGNSAKTFVVVSSSYTGSNSVMTSPDGITWTLRTIGITAKPWNAVSFGNGLFIAVANSLDANGIMISEDGINWYVNDITSINRVCNLLSVCCGAGLFFMVGRVATYPNAFYLNNDHYGNNKVVWNGNIFGIDLTSCCYGNGMFVAVSDVGSNNCAVVVSGYELENY